ncbi:MAG: DUF4116 domain-containing protein [Nitrospinaceae bacterium]|jgi:hypothetical protein|nr:DUF4116 domain-containing protein [Alphaproteobacteria bacterium]MDP6476442.1 DUF4116 domain-containing protein [Nitrospinaceae bacterium]|tara:strand:+ start:264 stop:404 length:141 start_codon:yes stop_codon:yes gene_type:complete
MGCLPGKLFGSSGEVVLEAVKEDGWAPEYAVEELKNDPELKKIVER